MIWATVSSRSCFYWPYRASLFLAAKNINNLNFVLTIWWCTYVESSLVFLEKCVCYNQCVLLTKFWSPLPCFILYSKAKLACYSRYLMTYYLYIFQSPMMKKALCVCVCVCVCVWERERERERERVLKGVMGLHWTSQLQLLCISGWGIGLDYYDVESFALETNWDNSVIFEPAPKYCIFDSFVDYEGYSISSKGFLLTVVDIMVIWIKFAHFHPSYFTDSSDVSVHSWHLLLDHVQFTLTHGPNIPYSYAILFFTAWDFTFPTRHIHNRASFLLWSNCFSFSQVISNCPLLFPSRILDTFQL